MLFTPSCPTTNTHPFVISYVEVFKSGEFVYFFHMELKHESHSHPQLHNAASHCKNCTCGGNFSIRSHTLREIQNGPKGRGKNTKLGEVMKIL